MDKERIGIFRPPERVGAGSDSSAKRETSTHALAYRPEIDGIRAIAVVAVMLFHAKISGFRGGFVGVDIFFVISGYLISGIIIRGIERGNFSFRDFYTRRINRIFPALIAVLISTLALGWYLLFPHEFVSLGKHVAASAAFLSNLALFKEIGYFDVSGESKPLLHLWSLAIEEQFYLVWPLFLVLIWKTGRRAVWVVLGLGVVSFFFASGMAVTIHAQSNFYFPFSRLWELNAGFALFYFEQSNADVEPTAWTPWLGITLIVASIFFFDGSMPWPSALTAIPVIGTILVLCGGRGHSLNRFLSNRVAVGIGLISYPLYLWHWPLLAFGRLVATPDTNSAFAIGAIAVASVLAVLTYLFIEWPFRARADGRRRRAVALLAVMALVCAAGVLAWRDDFSSRLDSARTRAVQAAVTDWTYPGGALSLNGSIKPWIIEGAVNDTVVFAGDSNMEQYWARAEFLVRNSGRTLPTTLFATAGGCPMLPNVGLSFSIACKDFFAHTYQYMEKPGVRAVVIASSWERLFTMGILYREGDPARVPLKLGAPASDSVFNEFEQRIARLVAQGKRVYVILSMPTGDVFEPPRWLPNRLFPVRDTAIQDWIDRPELVRRTAPILDRIRQSAANGGATILDPVPYLCSEKTCPAVDEKGEPLYRDGGHLRAKTVRERATFIDRVYNLR